MKFVRYTTGSAAQWGVRRGDEVVPLFGLREEFAVEKLSNPAFCRTVADTVDGTDQSFPADDVRFLAPVPRPPKFICVGLNYHDHAEEQDKEIPEKPLLFGKAPRR